MNQEEFLKQMLEYMSVEELIMMLDTQLVFQKILLDTLKVKLEKNTKNKKEKYTCNICDREFNTQEDILSHIKVYHPKENPGSGEIIKYEMPDMQ